MFKLWTSLGPNWASGLSPGPHPAGRDCHLLIWPGRAANPSQIMQKLSERTTNFILRNLRENLVYPWCRRMLKPFELPLTVHYLARYGVWNRRGYDMNVWSEKKIHEKLNYTHNNPVKRGFVAQRGEWPWSRRGGEVLLLAGQFCFDYGPDSLRCNCERSHCDNCGADIQTNVCALTGQSFLIFRLY
jgi:REP element-mobilizing transposase RayT